MTLEEIKERYPKTALVGVFFDDPLITRQDWEDAREKLENPPQYCFPFIIKLAHKGFRLLCFWYSPIVGYGTIDNINGIFLRNEDTGEYEFIELFLFLLI